MKAPPPPVRTRPQYSSKIRAMKPKGYQFFPGASPATIKSVASRIGKQLKRIYYTQKEPKGISCWRET